MSSEWNYTVLPKSEDLSKQELLWEDLILPLGFAPNIQRSFITPIKKNLPLHDFSAIIFGPPGTGKTTLLKAIAKQLGWKLFLIGPQHFMEDESIEKSMVQCIKDIKKYVKNEIEKIRTLDEFKDIPDDKIPVNMIIAFDEIDELVISRDNEINRESRFSTTVMLPLFQELHDLAKNHRFIFFSLTNHIERFDSAITRRDRFDLILPFGPPDRRARFLLFEMYLNKITSEYAKRDITIRRSYDRVVNDVQQHIITMDIDVVSRASARLTLKDIEAVCMRVVEQQIAYDDTRPGEFLILETRYFIDWIYKYGSLSTDRKAIEKFYADRQKFTRDSAVYPKLHTLQQQVEHEFSSIHINTNIISLREDWHKNDEKTLEYSIRNITGLSFFEGSISVRGEINNQIFEQMIQIERFLQPGESSGINQMQIKPLASGILKLIFTIDGKIDLRGIEEILKRGRSGLTGKVIQEREIQILD